MALNLWAFMASRHLLRASWRDGSIFPLESPHASQLRGLLIAVQFRVQARRCLSAYIPGVRPSQPIPGSLSPPEDEGPGGRGDRYGPYGNAHSDARFCSGREATGRRC